MRHAMMPAIVIVGDTLPLLDATRYGDTHRCRLRYAYAIDMRYATLRLMPLLTRYFA